MVGGEGKIDFLREERRKGFILLLHRVNLSRRTIFQIILFKRRNILQISSDFISISTSSHPLLSFLGTNERELKKFYLESK